MVPILLHVINYQFAPLLTEVVFNSELLPLFTKLNAREVESCHQTLQSDLNDEGKYSFQNIYTLDVLTDKHVSYVTTIYAKLHP